MAEDIKTPEEEIQQGPTPEQKEAMDALNRKIDAAIHEFVVDLYKKIDTKSLFEALRQPEKNDIFTEYMKGIEEKIMAIQEEKKKAENCDNATLAEDTKVEILPWWDFLDEKPIDAKMLGQIWDNIINTTVRISIQASQAVTDAIYDNVIGPQFANTQRNLEGFAHGIGELARHVDELEKK